jgi:hypothetical protein
MEITKTEEDCLDLGFHLFEIVLGEESQCSLHVCLEALRRLIGKLNGSLKDTNGDFLAGVSREIKSKIGVRALSGIDIQFLFKLFQEAGHEMDVLEHNPVAFLVADLKLVECDNILTLTQGDLMKVFVGVNSILSCQSFDVLDWVGSWGQDEENGSGGGRISIRLIEHHEEGAGRVTINIVITVREGLSDKHIESCGDTIRSETSDDKQLLEELLIKSLPIEWKFYLLW